MVGQNIGKYRVVDRVGRGGMGTVYRAVDETLHREVAIKVLNAELSDPAVAKRFRAEAVTVARLNHPAIATIYELFQNEGQWLMVMEFVRGETLEALVARKGIVPLEEAVELCMQTLGALAHAHGLGVVHRDLKPANLMVTESGNLKVMDFGIARVAGTEHLTSAGFMMGTPAYMAPEQVLGQDIDARADLYAVGVVLYYLTTAKLPFKGDTPFEMARSRIQDQPTPIQVARPESPAWLGQVLEIALARQPERRFPTAPVFREALRRGLANLPIETPTTTSIPPELIVTTPPGSMPTLSPLPVPPAPPASPAATTAASAPTGPPPSPVPVAVASVPIPTTAVPGPAAAAPKPGTGPSAKRSLAGPLVGIAATALVLATVGGWFWTRSHRVPPATEVAADATPPAAAPVTAPPAPPPPVSVPDTSVTTPSVPAASTPLVTVPPSAATTDASPTAAAGAPSPTMAGAPSRASTASGSTGRNPNASSSSSAGSSASAAAGRSTTSPAAGTTKSSASASARGRSTAPAAQTADPHLAFGDLHALVVTGTKTDEEQVSVHFFSGQISVILQKNGATMALVPYREFVRATYVHAKAPKWDPKLTAPPADVDMPGGLFRSARHWLTLQAKSTYVILRLNDDDFQRVLDTVTSRMGVKVDAPSSD